MRTCNLELFQKGTAVRRYEVFSGAPGEEASGGDGSGNPIMPARIRGCSKRGRNAQKSTCI